MTNVIMVFEFLVSFILSPIPKYTYIKNSKDDSQLLQKQVGRYFLREK